jgi:PAS domain S-box-containing protein
VGAIESLSRVLGFGLEIADEQLFERAAALSSDLIYLYDARERRVVFCNQSAAWPGLRLGLEGRDAALHPDDALALRRHRAALAALPDGEAAEVHVRIATGRGDHRWVTSRETVLARGTDGTVRRVLGVGRALEPAAATPDAALRDSEERLRLATSLAGIGTWDWDLTTDEAVNSESYFRLYGIDPSTRPPSMDEWLDRVHPDDRARMRELTEQGLRSGVLREAEFRVVWPDGSVRWLLGKGRVFHDETGRRTRMIGVSLDITERKRAELALRGSEERYRSLVAATSAIVWTADPAGQFIEPQPSWETFTGQAWPEYARAGRLKVVHPDDRRAVVEGWSTALRERSIYETAGRIWHAERREYRHCWTRAVPMIDAGGTVREWVGCVLDVTDRWRAEEEGRRLAETLEQRVLERTRQLAEANLLLKEQVAERRQAEEALRQSQKIEAVGQLTGGVAHDFNNLLTIILGNLELMERVTGDAMALKCLRSATQAAERGAKLAEQLLAFSRKQRLSPRPTDVNRLIAGVLDLLRRTLGAAVEVETRLAAEPWPAMVDANQIELVLLNLAINARDAMGDRGTLTLATANVSLGPADDPELMAGDYIRLTVADTGTGMTEEVRGRAFEPFFTTKEVGKGSGLGLSMVYGVAKQLGGSARIDSRLGEGTAIVLHLPRAAAAAPLPGPSASVAAPPRSAPGAKVLLVDDDDEVRLVTAATLRRLGHGVIERADGEAALAALAEHDDVALLLVDWGMPRMDGLEVTRRARAMRPDLAVLLCTGYGENGPFAGQFPGHLVLRKPYRAHELAASIKHALEVAQTASREG